jgi:hypothetical protein
LQHFIDFFLRRTNMFFMKFRHNYEVILKIVPPEGLEPTTKGLKGPCSTIELRRQN